MKKLEDFLDILNEWSYNSRKDHLILDCPFCGKSQHLYFNYLKMYNTDPKTGRHVSCWDCKRCGESGNIHKFLRKLNRLDFFSPEKIELTKNLLGLSALMEENPDVDFGFEKLPMVKLPMGFNRIYEDEYLTEVRNIKDQDFLRYVFGRTDILPDWEKYVILPVFENSRVVGYYGRTRGDYQNIKRWKNSNSAFSEIVFGIDEINFLTEIVVIVEGFFDKKRLDDYFGQNDDLVCVHTFGKRISPIQASKIKFKGVDNLIIIQDPDAAKDTKKTTFALASQFESVSVGFVDGDVERDLDNCGDEDISFIFSNLMSPMSFKLEKVGSKLF